MERQETQQTEGRGREEEGETVEGDGEERAGAVDRGQSETSHTDVSTQTAPGKAGGLSPQHSAAVPSFVPHKQPCNTCTTYMYAIHICVSSASPLSIVLSFPLHPFSCRRRSPRGSTQSRCVCVTLYLATPLLINTILDLPWLL